MVADGAGQNLRGRIEACFKTEGIPMVMRHFDPGCIVRGSPANARITRVKMVDVFTQQLRCVSCYADAVNVSRERCLAGKASYYEILEAQQQLFPAENKLAQTQLDRLTAIIQLYKVLGGGWNLPNENGTNPISLTQ